MTQKIADKLNVKSDGKKISTYPSFAIQTRTSSTCIKPQCISKQTQERKYLYMYRLYLPTITAPIQNNRRYISQQLHYLEGLTLARGFIEKVEENEDEPQHIHYIPHLPAKKDSTTTLILTILHNAFYNYRITRT